MATATKARPTETPVLPKEKRINFHGLTEKELYAATILEQYVKHTVLHECYDHPINPKKYWGTIPTGLTDFLFTLKQAAFFFRNPAEHSFLDIGCGLGHTLTLAKIFHLYTKGIENNFAFQPRTAYDIWFGDAFDYPDYSLYDIIYQYRPFRDNKLQAQLEEYVEDSAKVGAIIFKLDHISTRIQTDQRFQRLYHKYQDSTVNWYLPLWLKISP